MSLTGLKLMAPHYDQQQQICTSFGTAHLEDLWNTDIVADSRFLSFYFPVLGVFFSDLVWLSSGGYLGVSTDIDHTRLVRVFVVPVSFCVLLRKFRYVVLGLMRPILIRFDNHLHNATYYCSIVEHQMKQLYNIATR